MLSEVAIQQATNDAGLCSDTCGMGWWTNADGRYPDIPRDAVWGAGAGDQVLFVVPSLQLIVVRNGQELAPAPGSGDVLERYHDPRAKILFVPLIKAVKPRSDPPIGNAPYPPSPVIAGIRWAPRASIARAGQGSDNWPMTWADDDTLYGAYGDGNAFRPVRSVHRDKAEFGLGADRGWPDRFPGAQPAGVGPGTSR